MVLRVNFLRCVQVQYIFLLLMLIFLPFSPAQSVTVNHLNQTTVPISNRSDAALTAAFKAAFSQVLIKMSGNPHVMTLPAIQNDQSDSQRWVESYRYDTPSTDETPSALQLVIQFDRQGIAQLLQAAGQSLWSADRPLTLVVIDANRDQWEPLIQQLATAYGLPVIFSAMDLTDQTLLQSTDALTQLAKRYDVSSVLMVHVDATSNDNRALQAQYNISGNTTQWTVSGDNAAQTTQALVARWMDDMIRQIGTNNHVGSSSTVKVYVMGVRDIGDYVKVTHYLRQKEGVKTVSVKDVTDSGVLYAVQVVGGLSHFQEILTSDSRIKVSHPILSENANQADLYIYW